MPWPKKEEQAILTVGGKDFRDWTSVSVKHEQSGAPPYVCRFTVSEPLPLNKNVGVMQIKPGDECTVTLAGQPAFKGRVSTRQAYIDSNRHHVELICTSLQGLINGSVIIPNMELKNKTLGEATRKVLDPLGIKTVFENGAEPTYRFPRLSPAHGEGIYDWLDVISRSTPVQSGLGIRITSNPMGDFVYTMDATQRGDSVTEGKDMLVGREIVFNPETSDSYPTMSMSPGSDKAHGSKTTHEPFFNKAEETIFAGGMPAKTIVAELPTFDKGQLENRNGNESGWVAGTEITVWLTVYGWLRPSDKKLWDRNQTVSIYAPSLMMKGDTLKMKSVTFTQDDRTGTRTTLELCNDAARRGGKADIT